MDDDSPPTYEKREKRKLQIDEDDDLLELDLTLASSQSSQSSQESPPKKLKIILDIPNNQEFGFGKNRLVST